MTGSLASVVVCFAHHRRFFIMYATAITSECKNHAQFFLIMIFHHIIIIAIFLSQSIGTMQQ